METAMLLETYLKKLRLPTFLHNYARFDLPPKKWTPR